MSFACATVEIFFEVEDGKPLPTAKEFGDALGSIVDVTRRLGVKLDGVNIEITEDEQ